MRDLIRQILREELLKEELHTYTASLEKGIGFTDDKSFDKLKNFLVFEIFVGGKLVGRTKCGTEKRFDVKFPEQFTVLGKVDCVGNKLTVGINGSESLWKGAESTKLTIKLSNNSIKKLNELRASVKSVKPEDFVLTYTLAQLKQNPQQKIEISGDSRKFKAPQNNTQKSKDTKERGDKERLSKIADTAKNVTKKVAQGVAKGTKAVAKGVAKGTKVVAKNVAKGIENTVDNVKDRVDDMKDKNRNNNNPTPPQGRGSTTRSPNF